MELFLKIVAPVQSYDFQTFFHNLVLALPASALVGLLLFFILGALSSLKSKEQRFYIVVAIIIQSLCSLDFKPENAPRIKNNNNPTNADAGSDKSKL